MMQWPRLMSGTAWDAVSVKIAARQGAITLIKDNSKGGVLDVEELKKQAC